MFTLGLEDLCLTLHLNIYMASFEYMAFLAFNLKKCCYKKNLDLLYIFKTIVLLWTIHECQLRKRTRGGEILSTYLGNWYRVEVLYR